MTMGVNKSPHAELCTRVCAYTIMALSVRVCTSLYYRLITMTYVSSGHLMYSIAKPGSFDNLSWCCRWNYPLFYYTMVRTHE